MPRAEFSRKTKREALERSGYRCEATGSRYGCHACLKEFERGYRISSRRAQNPQFCSQECYSADQGRRARERFANRFWSRVSIKSSHECWEWTGRKNAGGYGLFDSGNRPNIASRISYELQHGKFPDNLHVCHTCDNPSCVNPGHLWLGTDKDNMQDAKRKGRTKGGNGRRGSEQNMSRLTETQASFIKRTTIPATVLAREYGVSTTAIYKIRNGENWGWLNV